MTGVLVIVALAVVVGGGFLIAEVVCHALGRRTIGRHRPARVPALTAGGEHR